MGFFGFFAYIGFRLQNQNSGSGIHLGGQSVAGWNCSTQTIENDETSNDSEIRVNDSKTRVSNGL